MKDRRSIAGQGLSTEAPLLPLLLSQTCGLALQRTPKILYTASLLCQLRLRTKTEVWLPRVSRKTSLRRGPHPAWAAGQLSGKQLLLQTVATKGIQGERPCVKTCCNRAAPQWPLPHRVASQAGVPYWRTTIHPAGE